MRWSWKLGTYAGIDVYMHTTFILLIGWIALSHWLQAGDIAGTITGVIFILLLFLCVVLHEYGHALTARKFGIKTRDITLLPIGGVARLERMPDDPRQEFWVAVAGPAVNLVIAVALYAWLVLTQTLEPIESMTLTGGSLLERLMLANVFLVGFNMLPAFPMDGGRVLRALLATRMEYTRATNVAAGVGQGMAFLFGLIGLFANPFLLFIALFVWIGAAQESATAQMKYSLAGIPISRAMITDFRTLSPRDTLSKAVELILAGSQQDFPVVENGHVLGVLTRKQLMLALTRQGEGYPVSEAMESTFQVADASEMLETVFQRLQECQCHTVPVTRQGTLVGLITSENLGEYMMIQAALRSRHATA